MPSSVRRKRPVAPPGVTPGCIGPAESETFAEGVLRLVVIIALVWGLPIGTLASGVLDSSSHGVQGLISMCVVVLGLLAYGWCDAKIMRPRIKRDLADVEKREGRVCLFCRQDVPGEPDRAKCPACGQEYELPTLKRSWDWTYSAGSRALPLSKRVTTANRYPKYF